MTHKSDSSAERCHDAGHRRDQREYPEDEHHPPTNARAARSSDPFVAFQSPGLHELREHETLVIEASIDLAQQIVRPVGGFTGMSLVKSTSSTFPEPGQVP